MGASSNPFLFFKLNVGESVEIYHTAFLDKIGRKTKWKIVNIMCKIRRSLIIVVLQ